MLEIRLFGTPIILYEGQPLSIQRRTTRALLYYLAANGQPVGRAHLATFFWPDLPPSGARARLRDHLGKLRSELPDATLLIATPQTISLDFERVSVDVVKFQQLHNSFRVTSTASLAPTVTYNKWAELVNLWQDVGFINGVDLYDSEEANEWLDYTRRELESEYLDAIHRLFRHDHAAGNLSKAIQWLRKALQKDPQNQDLHLLLVKTLLDDGKRTEARHQLEFMHKVLDQEFEPELLTEIQTLEELADPEWREIPISEKHPWPLRPSFNVPYVGQEQALSQIGNLYKRGGAVIIFGEAGAGKTRLAKVVHDRIHPHPKLLLTSGDSIKTDIPFHPWIELLLTHAAPEDWQKLTVFEASLLWNIIPELAYSRQDIQPLATDGINPSVRLDLLKAIYHALEIVAGSEPMMLFLDDVHWADESSLDFLHFLLDHSLLRQPNRVLLMAARIEEPSPGLEKIQQAFPGYLLEQTYLERLTDIQVSNLISSVLGETPDPEFVERMSKSSGGNPFFVLEILQAILDSSGDFSFQSPDNLPLSQKVYKVIRYRLKHLSSDAHEIIQTAAIMGNHFSARALERASAFPEDRFVAAMEELRAARLITELSGSNLLEFSFVHESIRETLIQELTPLRAKHLHQRVARALEEEVEGKSEGVAAILAQHYEDAEAFQQAFDYWLQAGNNAFRMTATTEAFNALRRAKRLIPLLPNQDEKRLYKLYSTWADFAFNWDDPTEIETLNKEFLEIGRTRQSDLIIGAALDGLSDACFVKNDFEQGLKYAEDAIPYLQRSGNKYEFWTALIHRDVFYYMMGDIKKARDDFYSLYQDLPADADQRVRNHLSYQLSIIETLMGWPKRGLEYAQAYFRNREAVGIPGMDDTAFYAAMGLAYYLLGNFKAGLDACLKGVEAGKQYGYYRMLGYSYAYGALSAQHLGLFDQAWEMASQARDLGQQHRHNEITALAYRTLGDIFLRLQDYESAIEYINHGIQLAEEHFAALELLILLGFALYSIEQTEKGLEYLNQAYQMSSQAELGSISVLAQNLQLYVQSKNGNVDSDLLEKIELALVDAQVRSVYRANFFLKPPFININQRTDFLKKQLEDSLQEANRLADPLLEVRILQSLIVFKKKQNIPCQSEINRMDRILEELAPHVKDMPFESAWKKYMQSIKETY